MDDTSPTPLLSRSGFQLPGGESRLRERLAHRLSHSPSYTVEEISAVCELSSALLPRGFELEFEVGESLRALAKLSQVELKPAMNIRSHRKFIGPLIVWAKKLTWPFIRVHLREQFEGLGEFCARSVTMQAKLLVEIERLKQEMSGKEAAGHTSSSIPFRGSESGLKES